MHSKHHYAARRCAAPLRIIWPPASPKHHVAHGRDAVRVHRLDQRQHRGEPARIIADVRRAACVAITANAARASLILVLVFLFM
jgi:hypothetical protein